MLNRRGIRAAALIGAVLISTATAAWGAPRATVKPYVLSGASPTSVSVGETATFTVLLTNGSKEQQIGSANIDIPEFRFSGDGAAADGSRLELRNLAIAPDSSKTITFTATASCRTGGPYAWTATVKQSNDFNGNPGNDFVAGGDLPATSITGSCDLEFVDQPADTAGPNVAISSVPLDPGGAPVSVRVTNANGTTVTVTGLEITLGLAVNGGGATGFGPRSATANGIAAFPGITLNEFGTYRLRATGPDVDPDVSSLFNVWETVVDCGASDCDVTGGENNKFSSTLTSSATTGTLGLSTGGRDTPICGPNDEFNDLFNHAPGTVTANAYGAAADGEKIVTLVVEKKEDQRQPNNGVAFYEVCYAAPVTEAEAGPAKYGAPNQDPLTGEWVWVLPDCGPQIPEDAACVVSKTKDNAGRAIITFRLAPGDPTWW